MPSMTELLAATPAHRRDRPARVRVVSFGHDHEAPPDADKVWDVRHLRDVDNHPDRRHLTGLHPDVHALVVHGNQATPALLGELDDAALAAAQTATDRPVVIAIGSALGRHRAVVVAEHVAKHLWLRGIVLEIEHRDIDRPHPQHHTATAEQHVFDLLTGAARIAHAGDLDPLDFGEDDEDEDLVDELATQKLDAIVADWTYNGALPPDIARTLCERAYWESVPGVGALLAPQLAATV